MTPNVILLISSVCLTTNLIAQNLVPNPDFELRDADFCGVSGPNDLANSLSDWYSPTGASPDVYFTDIELSCWNFQPNSTYSGPIGSKGSQLPRSGSAMVGFSTYTLSGLNQREYIQVELLSPLVVSGKYLVEFYVSLGDSIEYAANNLGFNLAVNPPASGGDGVLSAIPQYSESSVIAETQNWVRVFDTITVTEPFEYLTIGNFSSDASTTLNPNPSASSSVGAYGAYYYIDDIRVVRVFDDVAAIGENVQMGVRLFPNPVNEALVIEFSEEEQNVKVEIIDVKGRVVFSEQSTFKLKTIDLDQFDRGPYVIRIESNKGSHTERIIKQWRRK